MATVASNGVEPAAKKLKAGTDEEELCYVTDVHSTGVLGTDRFPVNEGESKRYHLFVGKICPFAHRAEIARKLKGLEDVIGLTQVNSAQVEAGWRLDDTYFHSTQADQRGEPNPVAEANNVPDLYKMTTPSFSGRASIPVLFDTHSKKIVNTESAEIARFFSSDKLNHIKACKHPELDLYPVAERAAIDDFCDKYGAEFVKPLYQSGFTKDQTRFNELNDQVFGYLAKLDDCLGDGRTFVMGDKLTVADIHAYVHLIRFDPIYYTLYKLTHRRISDHPNIKSYIQRLWQLDGFRLTTDISASIAGYFESWNQPNCPMLVPKGKGGLDLWLDGV
ncbi:unnamed protein product [Vitrella brassicaformis CCMP3155]|uniref:GST C-terminal domain-containing protein n=1 Tax=Vitrella brassicaformis (strain CCMP3155) TaxID=1169540 RepID=A0A0G4FD54_VITBC|nr:unnamed protein product [Vitrella brassicaformis CCMP3155]|eukprot:CEM11166.1 unnamed protein product [Vitrella brassicaformis CCMP3155]